MKTKVYCKLAAKGQQAFYLVAENKEYYLVWSPANSLLDPMCLTARGAWVIRA